MTDNFFQQNGYLLAPDLIDTSAYFSFFKKLVELKKGKNEKEKTKTIKYPELEPFIRSPYSKNC
jgi:hypothetical protein